MAKTSTKRVKRKLTIVKEPMNAIHNIKRTLVGTLNKVAADTGTYQTFRLADLPSQSELTSLFQFYSLDKVQMRFILVSAPNNNATFPTLYIARQAYALSGVPGSRDEVLQFAGVETHQFGPSNLTKTISTNPCVLLDSSGSVGGGTIQVSPWLSTTNNGILHPSFVYWLTRYNSTTDSTHTIDVEFTFWLKCKGTR